LYEILANHLVDLLILSDEYSDAIGESCCIAEMQVLVELLCTQEQLVKNS